MKKCSTSLIIRDMHISQQSKRLLSKSLQTINAGEGVEKRELFCTVGGNINWYSHYGEQYGGASKKLGIKLPYDPTIPMLGIHPEKNIIERDTCTPMFISALFTVSRTRKQSRCPWTDKWIQKLWYIYTVGYYSAIKIYWVGPNEVDEPRAYYTEWSQKEKDKYCILTCAYGI